jgi:subtilisin-like proprotein convertase family protein/subtilisin family serine protease
MATNFFWQGGRKVEIEEDAAEITIQAETEAEANAAAARVGVALDQPQVTAPGMVRARLATDRDSGMSRLRQQKVVHHVYRSAADRRNDYLITDTFHIKFKPDTSPARIVDYLRDEHLTLERDLGDGLLLVRVTDQTGRNPIRAANAAATMPEVQYAEPNLIRQLQRFAPFIPADTLFAQQWHLHAPQAQGNDLVAGAGIFAPDAWELTRGSRDIVVCVADDAFDLTHPDFQGAGKIAGRWNLRPVGSDFATDADVSPRPGDYHGTPCAGVAVAEAAGTGTVGVAHGCSLLAVRFPLNISDDHMALMFERVSRVADVMSCSWGYPPADAPMGSALRDRIAQVTRTGGRRGKGLVICVAAGNNNAPVKDLGNTRTYQYFAGSSLRSYAGPIDRWIAAHPDVITVSACTSLKRRSSYSSWGREISVCAPSDNWDDLRRVNTTGRGILTTDNEGFGADSDFTPGSRFTSNFGGTSSATPTVAGVCALVLSRNPALTAREVKDILQRTADKDLIVASETTVNVPGAFDSGFSQWFGHGKVNAGKAVRAALSDPAGAGTGTTINREVRPQPPTAIPDTGQPVESSLTLAEDGVIVELRVSVDIQHPYVGDLRVDLIAPNGAGVTLQDQKGGSSDNLVKTFTSATTPALAGLIGRRLAGTWRLRVVDLWAMDTGTLRSWRLFARTTSPTPTITRPTTSPTGEPRPTGVYAKGA